MTLLPIYYGNSMKSVFFCLMIYFVSTSFMYSQNNVKIGMQVWISKNLEVSTFRNGEEIFHAKTKGEWQKASSERTRAWC